MVVAYVFLVIISGVGVWLAYWWLRVRHFEGYLKDIPGPKPLPIVGNGLEFASSTNILNTLTKYHKQFKGNFKVYVGSQPFIFFSEPKDLEFLLNSPILLAKSLPYRQLHSWLGTGLLTGSGDKWRKHRKIITPAFHFQILEEFVDIFNSAGDVLVSKLNEVCSQNISIDIYPFMTRCTLDIICETAMGTSVDAQNDVNSEYFKSVNVLLKILIDRAFSPFLSNDFFYRFSSTYQREQEALKVVHGYSRTVIERRMKEFLKNRNTKEQAVDDLGRKKKKAFLDLLLEYSSTDPSFTYENICEEVDTFMFEGHDTTATSISFALFALAAHPEVQKNAFSELQSIFSNDFYRSPTYQDLHEMRYLELVIRESLRIYTTIPFTGRTISQDTSFNGRTLPKGVMANLFSHATHNSEMIYKDPEKFQPERHTPENAAGKNIFSYVPFSAGPRNCIGQKFAMLEMKSIMSNVLRHFELTPAVPEHKLDLRSEAVLKSENGVIVQLKKRRALAKAYAEQISIFGDDHTRKPTFKELKGMNYLRMVILESMRCYTVIPAYGRAVPNSIKWWNGLTIPKDAILHTSAHGAHQSPRIFPQPEVFDPERFTLENVNKRNPFAYVPFSAGFRNCIGQKYAMLEMYALLSIILRNYEVRPAIPEHKIRFRVEAVLKADNGLFIRIVKRNPDMVKL